MNQQPDKTVSIREQSTRAARLAAFGFYLGLAPLALGAQAVAKNRFLTIHRNQALTLFAIMALIVLLIVVLVLALSLGMVYYRVLADRWPTELWLLSLGRKLLIAWGVFWGYGVIRAVRGDARPIPFLNRLAVRRDMQVAGMVSVIVGVALILIFLSMLCVADRLVADDTTAGRVYMVYDDLGRFPRALFAFAMLPVSTTANNKWGSGSVVLLPLSVEAVEQSLLQGAFVVIASHGTADGLILDAGYLKPEDVHDMELNQELEFVYIAGCDSGVQREAWEKAFYPAQVKTYDRMTPVIEHLWWLWTQGPDIVRRLPT